MKNLNFNFCGLKPTGFVPIQPSDSNYIFEKDINFQPLNLYDFFGRGATVNSYSECFYYGELGFEPNKITIFDYVFDYGFTHLFFFILSFYLIRKFDIVNKFSIFYSNVIAKYINLESVGLYAVGFMIGKLLYVLQDAITQVISPISMSGLIHDRENTKSKIAYSSLLLWVIMLYLNFGMYLFSKELIWIFADQSYSEAHIIIPIIGLFYVFGSQQRIFAVIISFKINRSRIFFVISANNLLK